MEKQRWASSNIVFGVGSYTYQHTTRDSFGCAIKATAGIVNGEFRELYKDPVTDDGTKKSARGLIRVEKEGADFVLYDQQTSVQELGGALEPVFFNGKLVREQTLDQIRAVLHG